MTIIAILGVMGGLERISKPSRVALPIPNSNTCLEILFGDLFEQDGLRLISVNDHFDSEIGRPVSDKSLHGVFLKRCFGGHPESFDLLVTKELAGVDSTTTAKVAGKTLAYAIGTTALVSVNQDAYLLFALTHSDPHTCKASSDVTLLWSALGAAWDRARIEAGGHPVNLPLVGSGLSGIGLPTRDLLNLLILSAITKTKEKEITGKIRIVLHRDRFDDVDLRDVKKYWSEK
ncbi:macro domain-containing protein [Rhodanobacter sp. B04]|uniref:macro domain-containing protein n=1 Tax=Rhodanobacter sp. B04 TaxID=1945860 RepID=UPI001C2C1BBC|nr:macro domain-containing protein [Rhodanobacter sp. B04]